MTIADGESRNFPGGLGKIPHGGLASHATLEETVPSRPLVTC
jgi:hypothetical protein